MYVHKLVMGSVVDSPETRLNKTCTMIWLLNFTVSFYCMEELIPRINMNDAITTFNITTDLKVIILPRDICRGESEFF